MTAYKIREQYEKKVYCHKNNKYTTDVYHCAKRQKLRNIPSEF